MHNYDVFVYLLLKRNCASFREHFFVHLLRLYSNSEYYRKQFSCCTFFCFNSFTPSGNGGFIKMNIPGTLLGVGFTKVNKTAPCGAGFTGDCSYNPAVLWALRKRAYVEPFLKTVLFYIATDTSLVCMERGLSPRLPAMNIPRRFP